MSSPSRPPYRYQLSATAALNVPLHMLAGTIPASKASFLISYHSRHIFTVNLDLETLSIASGTVYIDSFGSSVSDAYGIAVLMQCISEFASKGVVTVRVHGARLHGSVPGQVDWLEWMLGEIDESVRVEYHGDTWSIVFGTIFRRVLDNMSSRTNTGEVLDGRNAKKWI